MSVIGIIMPAFDSVAYSMSEVEYHSLACIEFIMLYNITLYIDAGIDKLVHNIVDIFEVVFGNDVKKAAVTYHAVLYSFCHAAGKLIIRKRSESIAVADYYLRLLESTDEILSGRDINSSFSAYR